MQKLITYIIHVKGNVQRRELMEKLLLKHPMLDAHFIEDGNIADLNTAILNQYFTGKMHDFKPFVSCAYKHILAMQHIAENNWALVLEDDIDLSQTFDKDMAAILQEIENRNIHNALVSIEDSLPLYVPKSERKKGQWLYQNYKETRLAGAYLLDTLAAKNILEVIAKSKSSQTADWFYSENIKKRVINCYWAHPVLASQKSLDGSIGSLIDDKKHGFLRRLNVAVQKWIKKSKSNFK